MNRASFRDTVLALEDSLDIAASLCRLMSECSGAGLDLDTAMSRASVPFSRKSQALAVIEAMQDLGLLVKSDAYLIPTLQPPSFWSDQAAKLEGAWACREILQARQKKQGPRIVVTTPAETGLFAERVRSDDNLYVRTCPTWETLRDLAERAERSFSVATPFLDREGADMTLDLFKKVGSNVEKHLILRFVRDPENRSCIRGLDYIESDLQRLGVHVHDFVLTGELGQKETFHAKIVLKDRDRAYVGSANLTREHSVEVGLLVFAEAAEGIAKIIDIMIEAS